jgi:uncharacterized protein YacL
MENNNVTNFNNDITTRPMTLGDWVVTLLLLSIPGVNIILMFVWGFSSDTNINKKNYCRAALIFMAIGAVIGIIITVLLAAAASQLTSY